MLLQNHISQNKISVPLKNKKKQFDWGELNLVSDCLLLLSQ